MLWRARSIHFRFPRPTLVMGIVNVTPDSFSDGGRFLDTAAAVRHGLELARQGADILDVGGESTRPGASPVPEPEELHRVLPVIAALARQTQVPISIDTYKPAVAEAAIAEGAVIVNDVGAAHADPAMAALVARTGAGYVAMHMQGSPETMQLQPEYADVVGTVHQFFRETLERLGRAGVEAGQVALDVGIGFGKTLAHNLELLGRMHAFTELERPILLGVSRKSFVGQITGAALADRLPGSLAATCLAVDGGVAAVRTHDVAGTVQALRVTEAILARRRA